MGLRKLQFPCECVSVQRGYSDPWAGIAQKKLLNDGTKERILNLVAREPRTIARLAKELGLSQPTVHAHVADMLSGELLREATEREKAHPAENYYEPAFPVIRVAENALLEPICREIAQQLAQLFEMKKPELEAAVESSGLAANGWGLHRHCTILLRRCSACCAKAARTARRSAVSQEAQERR
jgi:DNA-binding transcriptional ArsR family regulator